MKYIKTFESFQPINESLFGIDFSKIKDAMMAVKAEVERSVLPELPTTVKSDLTSQVSDLMQKTGSTNPEQLIDKALADTQKSEPEIEEIAAEEGVAESLITEGFLDGTKRFFRRLLTWGGLATSLAGMVTLVSNCMGYIDSTILTRIHDITQSILGNSAGPIGALALIGGVVLAIASQSYLGEEA